MAAFPDARFSQPSLANDLSAHHSAGWTAGPRRRSGSSFSSGWPRTSPPWWVSRPAPATPRTTWSKPSMATRSAATRSGAAWCWSISGRPGACPAGSRCHCCKPWQTVIGRQGWLYSASPAIKDLWQRSVSSWQNGRSPIPWPWFPGSTERLFGGLAGYPTSFLLDRQGKLRHQALGPLAMISFEPAVRRLLAEPDR